MMRHGGLEEAKSNAGLCRNCGKCQKACPQHLLIPAHLKEVAREMDGMLPVAIPVFRGALWCMNTFGRVRRFVTGDHSHD